MSQGNFTRSDIEHLLDNDEKISWSGQPDLGAMIKTAHRGKNRPWILLLVAVLLVAWVASKYWNQTEAGSTTDWMALVVGVSAILFFFKAFNVNKPLIRWVQPLGYAITDKRVLIFRNGAIESEYSQGDVMQASLVPRRGVDGFSDIIWAKEVWKGSTSGRFYPSPVEQEKLQTGFKALADGEAVMGVLDAWVAQKAKNTRSKDDEFVGRKGTDTAAGNDDKIRDHVSGLSNRAKFVSPVFGFSLELPISWGISTRYRKLAFGKWGIEREAIWSVPDAKPKWNVIRGHNESKTHVEVQVQKVAPFNTLESIMNTSSAARMLGTGEVTDHKASITINGIPGFYVTRHCGNADSILPAQIQEKLSHWNKREYVLHDGRFQYYIQAMWPADSPGQREVCEAVVATLTSCRSS